MKRRFERIIAFIILEAIHTTVVAISISVMFILSAYGAMVILDIGTVNFRSDIPIYWETYSQLGFIQKWMTQFYHHTPFLASLTAFVAFLLFAVILLLVINQSVNVYLNFRKRS